MLSKVWLRIGLLMVLSFLAVRPLSAQLFSFSVKNASLSKVFAKIELQCDVRFFYRTELLDKSKKVSIQVENATLKETLDLCFANQPLTYEVIEKIIVVKEKLLNGSGVATAHTTTTDFITVRGRVINEEEEPVAGGTITLIGTGLAIATSATGTFSVQVPKAGAVLKITSVGIETVEVPVNGNKELIVQVKTKIKALDHVQIIGYGQTTKRLNTGNVTTVKAVVIERQPVANALAALQGHVPGMFITQYTGVTGGGFRVLIRGLGTFRSGVDPLYIVDGVPYPSSEIETNNKTKFGMNGIGMLNIGDIERVEVLKDADATAIYGSRGGNGVVLISTKKAKHGQTTIDFKLYNGGGQVTRRPRLLNTQQYLQMRREIKRNDNAIIHPFDYDLNGTWDTTRYTDWSKELLGGTAWITDGQLSISGGSKTLNYRINGGYHRETTVMPDEGANRRYSVHFHVANELVEKKLKLELTGSYQAGKDDLASLFLGVRTYLLSPVQPPSILPDGSLNDDPTINSNNPYRDFRNPYIMNSSSLVSRFKASWTPVNGLELSTSMGFYTLANNDFSGEPANGNTVASAKYSTSNSRTVIIEPQAAYHVNLKRSGKLSALVGTTYQKTVTDFQKLEASGFSNAALLGDPRAATTLSMTKSKYATYKYLGTFSRLSYNLYDKYLLNITGRVDGTSRFGPGKQFHPFAALGAAWIFSEEGFMQKLTWINFAKLRGSYGTVGNSDIPDYGFLDTYAPFLGVYQGVQGLTPNQLFERNLGWELKKSLEVALELQLFKNRFGLSVSTYRNRSSQQLAYQIVSAVTGFTTVLLNTNTTVQNKGIEVVLSATPVTTGSFSWNFDANVSLQRNNLLRFDDLEKTVYRENFSIGKSITGGMIYRFGGVDPQTGTYFFIDRNGQPTETPSAADRTVRIDLAPKAFGGFNSSFSYKGLTLDVSSVFVIRRAYNPMFAFQRFTTAGLPRWQKPGDITRVPKHSDKDFSRQFQYAGGHELAFPDASYLRVRNLALSYNLSQKLLERIHLKTFRLYVQGQNLFTVNRIKNADPENIDYVGSIAPLRVITGGVQITF